MRRFGCRSRVRPGFRDATEGGSRGYCNGCRPSVGPTEDATDRRSVPQDAEVRRRVGITARATAGALRRRRKPGAALALDAGIGARADLGRAGRGGPKS